jgi:6-phosphofructokinase 1
MPTNVLVAHGGGPTAVINASLAGVLAAAREDARVDRVFGARRGIEGVLAGDLVDLSDYGADDIEPLAHTPASAIGSCRYKVTDDDHAAILETLERNGVGVFLYNGGNDSMDTCLKVSGMTDEVRVIGIPKTIDNDLAATDHSPGFGSAARFYAFSALELSMDVAALDIHVSVLEVMGRNAGWLTASADLAWQIGHVGPQMILVPEIAFHEETFLDSVRDRWNRGRGFVIAASEGLTAPDGTPLVEQRAGAATDAFGHALPGNVSMHLASLIRDRLDIRARSEKPGLIGRASRATVSEVDRREALQAGTFALRSALDGATGKMVGLVRRSSAPYEADHVLVPLEDVANTERLLPHEYIDESTCRTTKAFTDYALPLIAPPFPRYFSLS